MNSILKSDLFEAFANASDKIYIRFGYENRYNTLVENCGLRF